MFHSYGFKDSVICEFYLSQVPGVSVMKFPEFEDIPMPDDSKRNTFQAFPLCHGSCEFFFRWRKQGRWIWFLTSLIFGKNNFPLCYKRTTGVPIPLGFCIEMFQIHDLECNPKKILGFIFFRRDESSLSVWGSLFTLLQIRALRLVRHLVAVSELPQPEGKQEWCHIAELYRSYTQWLDVWKILKRENSPLKKLDSRVGRFIISTID